MKLLKRIIKTVLFHYNKILKKEFIEFHDFPFNEMSPMPLGAEIEMSEVVKFLEDSSIEYRITDGTVLGLYRNNDFIPHDNDIDIDVRDVKSPENLVKLFTNRLSYKIGRIVIRKGVFQQVAFYNSRNVIVDFIFWNTENGHIFNYQEKGYERKQCVKSFDKLDSLTFKGTCYKIPGEIESWLEFRYGEDWKIPKTYKDDWKEECGDLKKF